jgi:hypothetical protein
MAAANSRLCLRKFVTASLTTGISTATAAPGWCAGR